MKKSYLMIAAAATLFAACASNEIKNDVKNFAESPIDFSTFTTKQTKAENSGETGTTSLSGHHTTFKVWGAKVADGTHQAVYAANDPGTVTFESSAWSASPKKFWDKSATNYYFYAAAPASQSWGFTFTSQSDMSDGTITLADYTLAGNNIRTAASTTATASWISNTGADRDLMIASPCPVARNAYNKANPDVVNLEFNHILSRLNVLVQKGTNTQNSTVSLMELKVYGMMNKGSFNEKPNNLTSAQLEAGTIARWATPVVDGTYVPSAITLNGVTTTPQYVLETLIIPQNVEYQEIDASGSSTETEPYVYIKYSIDGEEFFGYYNLAAAFNATADDAGTPEDESIVPFNEGWQNNLTITINPAEIEFDAEVFNWATFATAGDITIE